MTIRLAIIYFFLIFPSLNAIAEPLKIGVLVPLSGSLADFGVAFKNGMDLAVSEKTKEQRDSINFILEDSAYDSKLSLSGFNKLLTSDKVEIVFVWGSTPSAVVAPLAGHKQIPVLTFTGIPDISSNKDYVIDFSSRLEDFGKLTLSHLRAKGLKKFGIIKTEIHYLEALTESIRLGLNKDESLIIIDSFQPTSDANFNTSIIKIRQALKRNEIDALGVLLMTGQLSTFFQKMNQANINIEKFGSDFMLQNDEMRKSGKSSVGSFFATIGINEEFLKKYVRTYNTDQQISYAAQGYDITNLLYSAYQNGIDDKDPKRILNKLENMEPLIGVLGKAEFIKEDPLKFKDAGKRFTFPVIIKKVVEDGKSIEISP
ncbi:MAG TPA: ABC transporter substrate-binding protein [Oligoflexia bacterium]|nr:ABC transporter substrate-binding protein [Oligoflexia bacterium]HMP48617.1 ABC transporter substrate-binding protein [Oligoflexia bacterium]